MKSSIHRALLTLAATGAITAAYGGMSTASAAPAAASLTPLWITATCGDNFEVWQNCVAEAGGGSGTGYTITWDSGKVTSGATSQAKAYCPENSGYRYVNVSVTDSSNGYAFTQVQIWCSPW